MIALALRTWVRYIVPLTLLAVVACAPLLYVTCTAASPQNVAEARVAIRLAWVAAGAALAFQLLLVAGVAPAVRAMAARTPLSQLGALATGVRGLVRGVVPWLVAVCAIILGGIALVVPGVLLAILLSLTGASESLRAGPSAALADSIATVRPQLVRIAAIIAAIVVVDLALTFAAQLHFVPLITKKLTATKLAPIRTFIRAMGLAIVALAPLAACALAAASQTKRR